MKISDEIVKQQFVQREYGLAHSTYDNELDFYQLVSSGDVKAVSGMLQTGEEDEAVLAARGILSDDKIRNQRYHEIVLVAMISRFCIEEGMEEMESYNLSDFYINKLDKAQTKQQITRCALKSKPTSTRITFWASCFINFCRTRKSNG